jgi:hypothetical protein
MNIVSSFTVEGYNLYGKSFIDSFAEFWPEDIKLTIYFEGTVLPDSHPRVTWKFINDVEHHDVFMSRLTFSLMSGNLGNGEYNINLDARMGRKVFIQMHAMKTMGGKVFWLDADSITFSKIPRTFLDKCLPDSFFNCFLGRDGWYYTESGFIGFNSTHAIAEAFYMTYLRTFLTGAIFTLKGWHDCYGFDFARSQFPASNFKNLAEGLPKGTMHPFVNSELGKYMDHRKGPRKLSRSTDKDLVISRDEEYWKNNA